MNKNIEQHIASHIADKKAISKNINTHYHETLTFGQKLADKVAAFGGSWKFIILFAIVLLTWIGLNSYILANCGKQFDPYPYILLNLILSMMASLQAPIIMMSQNRQTAKDRFTADHDYEINLKAELEIMELHAKIDHMKNNHLNDIINQQEIMQLHEKIDHMKNNHLNDIINQQLKLTDDIKQILTISNILIHK